MRKRIAPCPARLTGLAALDTSVITVAHGVSEPGRIVATLTGK